MSIMKMYVEEYLAAEQVAENRYIIHLSNGKEIDVMRKCTTDFRIGWKRSSGKEEKRLSKKWKKPEKFSGFFLLLGKQNQVFIGSYSVEAKRRLKSTCWRSKQEQISDRRPVFFRLKKRFSVFVICFWLASATKNCSDS